MGRIAKLYANKIYITDDNPRFEDSSKIRKSILKKHPIFFWKSRVCNTHTHRLF